MQSVPRRTPWRTIDSDQDRAARVYQCATAHLRSLPPILRNARSKSQGPNAFARLVRDATLMVANGASREDLRQIEVHLTVELDRVAGVPTKNLTALLHTALNAEHDGNVAEQMVLGDRRSVRALRVFAEAQKREAALDLEAARAAEIEADRLEAES